MNSTLCTKLKKGESKNKNLHNTDTILHYSTRHIIQLYAYNPQNMCGTGNMKVLFHESAILGPLVCLNVGLRSLETGHF